MSKHKWEDLDHKATPEQLADARRVLDRQELDDARRAPDAAPPLEPNRDGLESDAG
jgi:hypothetical protein